MTAPAPDAYPPHAPGATRERVAPDASTTITLPESQAGLVLLPQGGVLDPATATLLVADVHLGKVETFRRLGVPVPEGASHATLARLSELVARTQPRRVVFLGDLIHARLQQAHPLFDVLASWRHAHSSLEVVLVRGNHDRAAGELPARCGIDSVDEGERLGRLALRHELAQEPPTVEMDGFAVAGHWHPVVTLSGRADRLRLRCFWARPFGLLLPAFGDFTGGHPIRPTPDDQIYALTGERVVRLPSVALARRHRERS